MSGRKRFAKFAAVGFSGIFVNMIVMWTAHAVGINYVVSAVLATQAAIGWNLLLSERWVFHDRRQATRFRFRFVQYYLVNNADLLLRIPLMILLVEVVGLRPSPANLLLVVAASIIKYMIVNRFIYRHHDAGTSLPFTSSEMVGAKQ